MFINVFALQISLLSKDHVVVEFGLVFEQTAIRATSEALVIGLEVCGVASLAFVLACFRVAHIYIIYLNRVNLWSRWDLLFLLLNKTRFDSYSQSFLFLTMYLFLGAKEEAKEHAKDSSTYDCIGPKIKQIYQSHR